MNAPTNPKRNHHHVWQAYLKPWLVDGQIWCLENGIKKPQRTKKVAVQRDFYKLSPLSLSDLHELETLISQGSTGLQHLNHQLLDLLMEKFRIYAQVPNPTPAMELYMTRYGYETLEDYHGSIENSFASLLRRSLDGDVSFYQHPDEIVNFLRYICTQYVRTKGFKEKSMEAISAVDRSADFSRIWNILIHIFANNIGKTLYVERGRRILQILRNDTASPFITSDQPVINLVGNGDGTAPADLIFYYPISPIKALYLGNVDEEALDGDISEELATYLNKRMRKAAYNQVFAMRECEL